MGPCAGAYISAWCTRSPLLVGTTGGENRDLKHRGTRRRFSTRRKILGWGLVPHHVHLKFDHFCSFNHEIQDVTLNFVPVELAGR